MKKITQDDRININAGIAKGLSLYEISKIIKKSRSTIYREIIHNCYYKEGLKTCSHCKNKCSIKKFINGVCKSFNPIICERWKTFPYTCKGCKKSNSCRNLKRYYDCVKAQELSNTNKSRTRAHPQITNENLLKLKDVILRGILQGQSIHHIYYSNIDIQSICSEKTIRRYIYNGLLGISPSNLPRYVRFKHHIEKPKKSIVNVERFLGRTYSDFLTYKKEKNIFSWWEYDSVIGRRSDKFAILTITYVKYSFQFGLLILKDNPDSVIGKIRWLQQLLKEKYKEIFEVNLSDNGIEFSKFSEIEDSINNEKICNTFYTNPYKATDKPYCERNHQFVRYVLLKYKTFDSLTQEKVNLLFSHINSYIRESKQNKTPYDLMVERFGTEFLDLIGIKSINPKDVYLKPDLVI